ncbi:MAG TPA: thymidine phosphorylase [Gemmatimonadaceae bacterium]|nr:thymidine phosphorylase [Gemmatimonadaceae bacterium]
MTLRDLIERKRDGGQIPSGEWHAFARDLAAGALPDYQVAALLMAIYFRGLSDEETLALMEGMLESGKTLDLRHLTIGRVDKHSTGGVGDKVSLVLAPLVASCGVAVPMISGRGLGHTGGTLDKLETIPGFNTRLSLAAAAAQVERLGCALIGQTGEIAPADRRLYALRNATGTIASIPLIAASIMSKKLAEGLTGLVLDVKTGAGAFLPSTDESIRLAQAMIALGARHGCPVVALLTSMDSPLGIACGNAIEVEEAVATLAGGGPGDLRELTLMIGAEMLVLGRASSDLAVARARLEAAIESGAALEKLRAIVQAQGGDPRVCDEPAGVLPQPVLRLAYVAPRSGLVQRVDPRAVGRGITAMGGGRNTVEDTIDPSAGFLITARPGDRVSRGDTLATILARDEPTAAAGRAALDAAFVIGTAPPAAAALYTHRVTATRIERLHGPQLTPPVSFNSPSD